MRRPMSRDIQQGAWRALPILILLNALSLLDRQVLTLMVEPVKRDLHLSVFKLVCYKVLLFRSSIASPRCPSGG